MTFGKKNQTSPHNCPLASNLALALNSSRHSVIAKFHTHVIFITLLQKRCKVVMQTNGETKIYVMKTNSVR